MMDDHDPDRLDDGLTRCDDGIVRCWWPGADGDYQRYHDREWGRPVVNDTRLFEKICLEGFQAGLSWLTILRKRDNFRLAFAGFDIDAVASFDEGDVERLLGDAGIVRHRGKIEAAINNATRAQELRAEFGSLADFVWGYEPDPADRPHAMTYEALMELTETPGSRALSRDLKARGWRFVGPTTMYAFLQSMGVVNDHLEGCEVRLEVERERADLVRSRA